MNKNLSIGLLAIIALAGFGYGWNQHRQLRELKAAASAPSGSTPSGEAQAVEHLQTRLDDQRRTTEEIKAEYEEKVQQLSARIEELHQQNESDRGIRQETNQQLKSRLQAALAAAPPAAETPTTKAGKSGDQVEPHPLFADLAGMLKNPGMKEMVEAQQKAMMDMTHKSLFKLLNLPGEEQEKFKDLLMKKQMQGIDIGAGIMDNTLTDGELEEKTRQMTQMNEELDLEIKELLGDENYSLYQAYEETQGERMVVDLFNQELDAGQRLDDVKQNDLIWAMHEAALSVEFPAGMLESVLHSEGPEEASRQLEQMQEAMSMMNPENLTQHLEYSAKLHDKYIEAGTPILTPEQLAQFRKSLEQQRSMQELGLKMMSGFLNPGANPAESPVP